MSIREKTINTFLCVHRSVMRPESNLDRNVGRAFWIIGLFCCSYWLWRWDILLWPGRQLIALIGFTSETSKAQVTFFSGLAFIASFVLFVFALFAVSLLTEKSPREFLTSKRQLVYRVLHWLCVGSTVASLSYAAFVLGEFAVHRAALWDAWAQSAVFALIGLPASMLLHYLIKYWKRGKPLKYTLDGPFRPSVASSLTAIFVAVWYSYMCFYPLIIHGAYSNLQSAYKNCNVFEEATLADPFLAVDHFTKPTDKKPDTNPNIYKPDPKDVDLLHRLLKYTGIIRATVTFDDFSSDSRFAEDLPYFFQRDILGNQELSKPEYMAHTLVANFTSVRLAATVAGKRGGDAAQLSPELETCIAANLAGTPNCDKQWNMLNSSDADRLARTQGFFEIRPLGIPIATSDQELVRGLLKVTSRNSSGVARNNVQPQPLSEPTKAVTAALVELEKAQSATTKDQSKIDDCKKRLAAAEEDYAKWNFLSLPENRTLSDRLLEETIARTHSTPQVKAARFIIALVQGAEQLGMLMLGVWLACLLVIRCRSMFALARMKEWLDIAKPDSGRSMNADEVKAFVTRLFALESADSEMIPENVETRFERIRRVNFEGRWLMRWIAQALPAVGFIGTVRGISAGLGSADAIVRAENVIGQAAAINQVAGSLGIAFTTTLIALVFGLVLGILERLEANSENGMLSRLETACVVGSGAQKGN